MTDQDIQNLENPRIEIRGDVFTLFKLVSAGGENKRDISCAIPARVVVKIKQMHNLIRVKGEGYELLATKEHLEAQLATLMQNYESHLEALQIAQKAIIQIREAFEG